MKQAVRDLLNQVESVPDFFGVNLSDINDTNSFGDNALHCVCVWGDFEAVMLLVENGINIRQKGEGGFTPLKVADDFGHQEIVNYLISKGANVKELDAQFEFNSKADAEHMEKLQQGVEELESKYDQSAEKMPNNRSHLDKVSAALQLCPCCGR
ncbi:ankyrin repeat domain-containing protein [Simiduia curdlanivorans]|uniref:Ankyrin repeat domain-containing protein n=1 Tax=Simiduia curdlanivorans TaxID=1492769 RepID=A0ABV8V260_9GAMM|nr:ankyrin repeat domain-containing protein [Simiduia curdlanivorans]MDN3638118.1 ankyrin repeat domain-containing protein [Simiduia curdlanivorans]